MPQKIRQGYWKFPRLHNFHEPEVWEQICHSTYQRINFLFPLWVLARIPENCLVRPGKQYGNLHSLLYYSQSKGLTLRYNQTTPREGFLLSEQMLVPLQERLQHSFS